jgi:hypothetical protein
MFYVNICIVYLYCPYAHPRRNALRTRFRSAVLAADTEAGAAAMARARKFRFQRIYW